jgi:multidrug efflux system membrane fusion protein
VVAKAEFANDDLKLWPGLYGDVEVLLDTHPDAVMLPTVAAQIGQKGQYVFVVKPDDTVEQRAVTLGGVDGDKTEVLSGLQADESVVIDGQLRLSNGSRVKPTLAPTQSAAADIPSPASAPTRD